MTIRYDAEELASTARAIGAQVIRGPVHYPGCGDGLDVGDVDIERTLRELKDQEVLVIVAPLHSPRKVPAICCLCGTPYEGGQCPACKAEREEAKRVVEERLLFDQEFSAMLSEG